ncbi:MAG: nucleoside triphosphate pyrophosphohydrolase, partial [Shewanella sp.]
MTSHTRSSSSISELSAKELSAKELSVTDVAPLLKIMEKLRDPQTGCPWDKAQTFHTIVPFT